MAQESNELAEHFDNQLLQMVKHGRPLITPDGMPLTDADGKPIMQPLTAADLNVIRSRLKDCGSTRILGAGGPLDQIQDELDDDPSEEDIENFKLKINNLGLADISQEDDAATA